MSDGRLEQDPRALLIRYLQEAVTKILAVCISIDEELLIA